MKVLLFTTLMVSIFGISCNKQDTELNMFFNTLQDSINSNKILLFKNAPEDSALFYFNKFRAEFIEIKNNPTYSPILDGFFDKHKLTNYTEGRISFLCFAFHDRLNNRKINVNEILNRLHEEDIRYARLREKDYNASEFEKKKLMQKNNAKAQTGDIINLVLPVKFNDEGKSAIYCNNYPASLDYSSFDDSLKITGKLLRKKYHTFNELNKIDTTEIIFELKILKYSNKNYEFFYEKYKIGDTIKIALGAYGRPII